MVYKGDRTPRTELGLHFGSRGTMTDLGESHKISLPGKRRNDRGKGPYRIPFWASPAASEACHQKPSSPGLKVGAVVVQPTVHNGTDREIDRSRRAGNGGR